MAKRTKTIRKTKQNSKINKKKPQNKKRSFVLFLLKIILIFAAIIAVYGIYLDQQIKEKIDGNVWQLPAAVYGKIIKLEPNDCYNQNEIITLLVSSQYRQVRMTTKPGEFVVNRNYIEIYRRPFSFPDIEESAFRVKIIFNQDRITNIINSDNGMPIAMLRIDPKLITFLHSPNNEQRLFVPLKDFPESLIQILIATEDKHFYQHDGISFYSTLRALYANIVSGKTIQGGSTLTQQLVKNLFLTNERSYMRKIREAYMALILDSRYSKERILELYLNEVYLGQDADQEIHGFPLASIYYFGRPVNELTLDQQALLVGMVKGASYYNPWTKPERVIERRNIVLKLIEEQNIIDEELYQLLSQRSLAVLPKGGIISPQPAFIQLVKKALREQLGKYANNLSGMKIFTTFDPITQQAAELALTKEISSLQKVTNKPDLQAAMVIVDRQTGEVRSLIGGNDPQYAGYNRALFARRPIGSLAKPPTYLTALSEPNRYQLNTLLDDKPLAVKIDNHTVWRPNNFDKQFRNKVMLIDALVKSLNIPSVNLGMSVGLNKTKKTLIALGVPVAEIKAVPARFLGALELTPLETAQMYQVISNSGRKVPLSTLVAVLSDKGEMIYQNHSSAAQVVPAQAAYLTTYAMQKVVESGTAKRLHNNYSSLHLAGKTGTTNDLRDSWFVGVDGQNVTVIWIGLDDHKPMQLTGSSGALKIYQEYLRFHLPRSLYQDEITNIKMIAIDKEGKRLCKGKGIALMPIWITSNEPLCHDRN